MLAKCSHKRGAAPRSAGGSCRSLLAVRRIARGKVLLAVELVEIQVQPMRRRILQLTLHCNTQARVVVVLVEGLRRTGAPASLRTRTM